MVLGVIVLHLLKERVPQGIFQEEIERDRVPSFHKDGGVSLEIILKIFEEVLAHLVYGVLLKTLKGLGKLL